MGPSQHQRSLRLIRSLVSKQYGTNEIADNSIVSLELVPDSQGDGELLGKKEERP